MLYAQGALHDLKHKNEQEVFISFSHTIIHLCKKKWCVLTLEGIRGGVNLTPSLDFSGLKFLFLDRLPKAKAQLFFVC